MCTPTELEKLLEDDKAFKTYVVMKLHSLETDIDMLRKNNQFMKKIILALLSSIAGYFGLNISGII